MKIKYILFASLLMLFTTISCKKSDSIELPPLLSGHFIIYHYGDQDKPVQPFIVKTLGDTTYLKFEKYPEDSLDVGVFLYGFGYRDTNIQDVSAPLFANFKAILLEYNRNNKVEPNYSYGTFKIDLMDNLDTLVFVMHRSEYTASFFADLVKVAKMNGLEKATKRFEKYKYMENK